MGVAAEGRPLRKGGDVKVTKLRLRELTGTMRHEGEFWEERLSHPLDIYPEHKAEAGLPETPVKVGDGQWRLTQVFLEVETDEGVSGLAGPVGQEVAFIIAYQLQRLVIGEDPRATERIWDKLYRDAVHGRKGATMMAISTVDCALWDLRGKWANTPVYRLLGGPVRETLPAYASALGYSLEPDKVRQRVRDIVAQGYRATKWFVRGVPTDGRAGMRQNLELMQTLREAAGPDVDIMLDAWMSWDVPYTLRMAEQLAEYDPRWIEEPVLPDKIAACAEIRAQSPVPIATGEHEYTRWGLKQLLDADAADVLQPDTYWAGGITEMLKICALASADDIPIIPHGASVPTNVQLIASQPVTTCPLVEYLLKWNQVNQFFFKEPVTPRNGAITLPTGPGMGVELDPTKIEQERELNWT